MFLVIAFLLLNGIFGSSDNSSQPSASFSGVDYTEEESELENPYNDGSGHAAGYEWAERKGVTSCGGNSQSFIEGCEEYLRQVEGY